MACIYRIYAETDTSKVYVGQTMGDPTITAVKRTATGRMERPLNHFSGLYGRSAEARENPMFFEYMLKNPLNKFVIEIYGPENNFGLGDILDKFLEEWHPGEWNASDKKDFYYSTRDLSSGKISIDMHNSDASVRGKARRTMEEYVNAAEILHNYIATVHEGKTCLSYQIGGQNESWISNTGKVLNQTMSIPTGIRVIDADRRDLEKLQKNFEDEMEDRLTTTTINGKTFIKASSEVLLKKTNIINKAAQGKADEFVFTPEAKKEITNLFVQYILQGLKDIYNGRGRHFNLESFTTNVNFKNMFSASIEKWQASFANETKGSFNIVNLIIQHLTTKSIATQIKTSKNPAKEIKDVLNKQVINIMIPQMSVESFISIIPPESEGYAHKNWSLQGQPQSINKAKDKNNIYAKSLKRMAYLFFGRVYEQAIKMLPEEPTVYSKRIVEDKEIPFHYWHDNLMYNRITTQPRLSTVLKSLFEQIGYQYAIDNWDEYEREMLTLYTQKNGTPYGAVNGRFYTDSGVPVMAIEPMQIDDAGIDYYRAWRFSSQTLEEMEQVATKITSIDKIEHF